MRSLSIPRFRAYLGASKPCPARRGGVKSAFNLLSALQDEATVTGALALQGQASISILAGTPANQQGPFSAQRRSTSTPQSRPTSRSCNRSPSQKILARLDIYRVR